MTAAFTRANPSPRYRELLSQYRLMHVEGEIHTKLPPQQTFSGQSLPRHSQNIKQLIDACSARMILDYGSGKGHQYTQVRIDLGEGQRFATIPAYWGVAVTCYDPGYEPFSALPTEHFDGVVCTDVLEHCPEDDIGWILQELFSFATKFVYANVACYPARKRLRNGENAHCTIRPAAWWNERIKPIAAQAPGVRYFVSLDEPGEAGAPRLRQTMLHG